ncbi:toll/interleukin-1 receptor domain-containing protein [Streptomyces sp. NPDC050997]|uniref:toll/interleukin-1 receptor domain-containing protein n=1 Tax=Streptomyces sp. NPDC050997 TaxID=3155519 RepID=UPI0034491F23
MIDVFISHSSRRDPLAGKVRKRVVGELKRRNYRVKVDTYALRGGREWCLQLMRWIAECDVAVVLLNRAALDSSWVLREVNILMWRRSLCPSLRVLPVIVGDVTTDQLKEKGFSELLPLQSVRLPYETGDRMYPGRLAGEVLKEFAGLPDVRHDTDHMRRWIQDVATRLDTVDDPKALMATGRALGIEDADLHHLDVYAGAGEFLAHHMLATATAAGLRKGVYEIARSMGGDRLRELITLLTPTWIDADAARRLLPPNGLASKHLVALNARDPATAGQYVDRAMCRQLMYYSFQAAGGIPQGEDTVDDLVEQGVEAVRQVLCSPDWQDPRTFRPREDYLHCLVLDVHGLRPRLVERVVARLHDLFPWLLIVLLADECDPARARLSSQLADLVVLPELTQADEVFGHQLTKELKAVPDRLNGLEVSA